MSLSTSNSVKVWSTAAIVAAGLLLSPISLSAGRAADAIFAPGEPIITGFSGAVAPMSPPPGSDPLDRTFIDPAGKSVVIQQLQPDGPPAAQLIASPSVFGATATDVGQVFGVTLDDAPDATGAAAPNIYVAATSAYGLNIVVPGPDGNPVRSKTGAAGATFMPGQWGAAGGATGYPGSIWKIDGTTGQVSLFTTIAANTGAGLGSIIYDPASSQFFVSDLDSGLIYRLAADGTIIDTYDHGVTGRPVHSLAPVADDGSTIDITSPSFNSEDPSTWGITQPERKVYGLAVHGGRLYYSVAAGPQIWSVGINDDGSFGAPRWELDVNGLPAQSEITSISFDGQGRMILAQRAAQVGSYDYTAFTSSDPASVVRYRRELPDDPSTPSRWVEAADSYAIGFAPEGNNATGGVALGYGYDADSNAFDGACNATLWSTGEALRDDPSLAPASEVAGLQGNDASLVRPDNDPPAKSFYTDFDGNTDASQSANQRHVGAVAIWQVCGGSATTNPVPPPPPDYIPPPDFVQPTDFNLTLHKWSKPYFCADGGASWWCNFTIRIENTGTVPYWGPLAVHDELPAGNPGASLHFWPQPPWACSPSGFDAADCDMAPVFLDPGDSVDLHEVVLLPKSATYCQLPNVASLVWPFWGHDDDPSDDTGFGVAGIKAPPCVPGGTGTNLALKKVSLPVTCSDGGADWLCRYGVIVQNTGPGNFSGPITVKDTLGINAPATTTGPWSCGQVGPVLTCNIAAPPVNAAPGWASGFTVTAHIKTNSGQPLCSLDIKANIASPPGGSPSNLVPGDDFDSATDKIPDPACSAPQPKTDLKLTKVPAGCSPFVYLGTNGYLCTWKISISNIGPNPYHGPLSMSDASAGATFNSLKSSPACTGPASNVTCVAASPVTIGAPLNLTVKTFYKGGPSVCSVTNTASILNPAPGSPQNPAGNDSQSEAQKVPNPACAAPPGTPKLNIKKTATGCASDPSTSDWQCDYKIVVTNYGTGPQPPLLKVTDTSNKPTTFTGAACLPSGPNTYVCTRSTPLNAPGTWQFQATAHVNPNSVSLADCDVGNTVHITTPSSAEPGYAAQAQEKVPQLFINSGSGPVAVYCDPPSLKLVKGPGPCVLDGGGYDCSFTVTATSTGPDPYRGTVELDELLPGGTTYTSSSWACKPTTGNDVHCSSTYVTLAVGSSTSMQIVVFVPKAEAVRSQCAITNTVNASISAAVLHSSTGAQYTASATDKLPADACAKPPVCPPNQLKPGGGCCDPGLVWNGRSCVPPKPLPPKCPRDSTLGDNGACMCKPGTQGTPGQCVPVPPPAPNCPKDSVTAPNGACVCKDGSHGRPGRCVPDQPPAPNCPKDSVTGPNGACVCKDGTHGRPGRCVSDQPPAPTCPKDSVAGPNGDCACKPGTTGAPGRCVPDQVIVKPLPIECPSDSRLDRRTLQCVCLPGTKGTPGQCVPDQVIVKPLPIECPKDSHLDRRTLQCVCNPPLVGKPGACVVSRVPVLQLPQTLQPPVLR